MAWTAGHKTFGTGGDYPTRSAMYADMGAATGAMSATQVSDITDVLAVLSNNLSIYDYSEDGQGFVTYGTTAVGTYSGTIIEALPLAANIINYTRLNLKAAVNQDSNFGQFASNLVAGTLNLSNSRFDGAGFTSNGPAPRGNVNVWNLMIKNMTGTYGWGLFLNMSTGFYENIVLDSCITGIWYGSGRTFKNMVFLNCTTNIDSAGATTINCATDKGAIGSGTTTAPQLNIVANNEFVSTSINAANAYKVKAGGQLATNGAAPTILSNTSGFYGNARPGSDGLYSIGADELGSRTTYFSSTVVIDGSSVNSLADLDAVVLSIQSLGANPYFDSTAKIRRVDAIYTQQPDVRQTKRIVHTAPSFVAPTSWSSFAHDGTWAKTSVRAYDWNDAIAIIPQSSISGEELTHNDGTMNLNT